MSEKKTFEVAVEPGMREKQRIVLRGEAGCSEPGLAPGDVVLVLQQKEHATFQRLPNPADLIIERTVSLREALCGTSFNVRHLDGRLLCIATTPGEVIKPMSFKVVHEEGMPTHGRPFVKGNLYVKFEVEFPDSIDPAAAEALTPLLPSEIGAKAAAANGAAAPAAANGSGMEEDAEPCRMRDVPDIKAELEQRVRIGRSGSSNAYDSEDDEDMPRGQRVQCAQQ